MLLPVLLSYTKETEIGSFISSAMSQTIPNKTRSQEAKNYKTFFSLATIVVVIITVLLLPKINKKPQLETPRQTYSIKRVTPAPSPEETSLLEVASQPPGNIIKIARADFGEGGYVVVKKLGVGLARSEKSEDQVKNLEIALTDSTKDGDVLEVILFDNEDQEIERKEVFITTTAITPSVILPKDLQN